MTTSGRSRGRCLRFSKNHMHIYAYATEAGCWRLVECRLSSDYDRCIASRTSMSRGTRFDGTALYDSQRS